MKGISIIFLCASMASCGVIPTSYQEPIDGDIAKIKFINSGSGEGSAEFFREAQTCKGREFSESIPSDTNKEINVAAGAPLSFSFGYNVSGDMSNGYTYCRVYGTFEPTKDQSYVAEIAPRLAGCALKFYRIGNPASEASIAREDSFRTRHAIIRPWSENSSFCK